LAMSIAIARPELLVRGVCLFAELLAAQGAFDVAGRAVAFALQQPTLMGRERDAAEQQMRTWAAHPVARADWTGPPLEELVQRIVAEAGQAYAPLMAELRGS
jgi:hypothetical protein